MELKPEMFKRILPLPVTLITTVDKKGVPNAAPYSCVMPVLRPLDLIAVAFALPRDTLKNIRETGEFVVNVMGKPSFRKAIKCAKTYPPEVNELEEVGLEAFPSKVVKPPRVKDAVGWIEARYHKELEDERYTIVVGKVVHAEINDRFLENGELKELPLVLLIPFFREIGGKFASRDEFKDVISTAKY